MILARPTTVLLVVGLVLAACTSDEPASARRTDDRVGLGVGRP